ncbi:hypothetical protein HMH01_06280 [Halovulum dunhuangense]|uniref:Sulfotransferase family protein n=1 Tax=Halovulum dunhuangense TaxID=1505036 RepID=A0A849L1A1_9RHOB|nr:hypothetical protein [Halovulum dunhuangense]NNU80043.1 hypothetical protein [Halovulum dunhuangense]
MATGARVDFVVLGMARTGSSLLGGMLRAHPEAYVHGEIFHDRRPAEHIREELFPHIDLARRAADPVGFIRQVLDFAPNGERVRGFKHFYRHNPEAAEWLIGAPGIARIVLERENRLAMYASLELARATGVYNLGPAARAARLDAVRQARIPFKAQAFRRYCETVDAIYDRYRQATGQVLHLTYAQVARGQVAPVFEFLGLAPVATPPAKVKLHGSDIAARFRDEDRPKLERVLERMGRREWMVEDAG